MKDRQRYKETEIKRDRGTDIWYYEAVDSEGEGYALLRERETDIEGQTEIQRNRD